MSETLIHSVPDLVDVVWRPDLQAVNLVWHSEYDEGTAVRDAVLAALAYANEHDTRNWVADISHSRAALSDADLAWVSGEEFLSAMRQSSIRRFVLVPPLPSTGQDTGWLADWEANTLAAFGEGRSARIVSDKEEIRAFLANAEQGEQE
ncbi:hypothetical protein [Aliiruegeria lutimaris]|uniref:SpoIIAA-like n=1 Tax=Aliiruegeria lutimaris TaxID=571298 RepID=A0A1G8IR37_9RHOB|nr:hypothetical protein [Aliiruegeria lutimaris]SDI21409.1 hypothetical protein SAMN04488026_1001106 [Aliiruegeria lutimaris]